MQSTVSPTPLAVTPASLFDAFAQVPDPRRAASVHFPLAAILATTVAAVLSGQQSVLAISEWIARQPAEMRTSLGFPDATTPHQSTVQRLFAKLDSQTLSHALSTFVASVAEPGETPLTGVAIDGKAHVQRGLR